MARPLRMPFVVTVSALGAVGCSRDATPTAAPVVSATATATATATPSRTGTGTGKNERVRLEDYPKLRNSEDAQKRTVFRGYQGDTCYIELPWPKDKPRRPGEELPAQDIACPAEMKTAAWEACRGGTIRAKPEGSDCICFQMGNPPPLPTKVNCP